MWVWKKKCTFLYWWKWSIVTFQIRSLVDFQEQSAHFTVTLPLGRFNFQRLTEKDAVLFITFIDSNKKTLCYTHTHTHTNCLKRMILVYIFIREKKSTANSPCFINNNSTTVHPKFLFFFFFPPDYTKKCTFLGHLELMLRF